MNPVDIEQAIAENLTALDVETKQINEDPNLSPQGKRKALSAIREQRNDLARSQAVTLLDTLETQASAASETYVESQQAHAAAVDPTAKLAAIESAKPTAGSGSWQEIDATIIQAIQLRDDQALQAWRSLAPVVAERFASDQQHKFDASTLAGRLDDALAALEPEDLRQAREQAAAAGQALDQARDRLGTYDFAAEMRGQSPLFADILAPRETVVSGGPGADHWQFTTTNWLSR